MTFGDDAVFNGVNRISQIYEGGQKLTFNKMKLPKVILGGHLNEKTLGNFLEVSKRYSIKKYQIIEACIYFYAIDNLNEREIEFFQLNQWGIHIT